MKRDLRLYPSPEFLRRRQLFQSDFSWYKHEAHHSPIPAAPKPKEGPLRNDEVEEPVLSWRRVSSTSLILRPVLLVWDGVADSLSVSELSSLTEDILLSVGLVRPRYKESSWKTAASELRTMLIPAFRTSRESLHRKALQSFLSQ
jgi:hypothetical protein